MDPVALWRRWRRLPVPETERFPSRAEAVLMAFAVHAAGHERIVRDIADAFAKRGGDSDWIKG